jgi:hypothetical protein
VAPGTLSRWRHGFKSRWDYQGNRTAGSAVSTPVKVQTWLRITAKAQVMRAYRAAPPAPRPAFVPQRTAPRHGGSEIGPTLDRFLKGCAGPDATPSPDTRQLRNVSTGERPLARSPEAVRAPPLGRAPRHAVRAGRATPRANNSHRNSNWWASNQRRIRRVSSPETYWYGLISGVVGHLWITTPPRSGTS